METERNQTAPLFIQGALASEIDLLLDALKPHREQIIGGFVFYESTFRDQPVIVGKTRMGEINSAIATTLAIEHYHPRIILNQGTAGALVDWLNTGDIVIGKRVCYMSQFSTDENRDADAINPWKTDAYRTLDGETVSYQADGTLLQSIRNACQKMSREVYFDVIASGDVWTKDPLHIHKCHQTLGAVCEAMECAGAYLAANSLGVPLVSIRAISNNELKHQIYHESAGATAQQFVLEILPLLSCNI